MKDMVLLTDADLDVVAGGASVTATADALAGSADGTASTTTRTATFTNGNVDVGHAFAMSKGDPGSVATDASVTPVGSIAHSESHTVTTPSGISISQANGVAH